MNTQAVAVAPTRCTKSRGLLAGALLALCEHGQHGHRVTPASIILLDSYTAYYWDWLWTMQDYVRAHGLVPPGADVDKVAYALYERVVKFWNRYRRLYHYLTEVKPQWKVIERISYADNSIEVVEQAADGRTRRRTELGPGGDACF